MHTEASRHILSFWRARICIVSTQQVSLALQSLHFVIMLPPDGLIQHLGVIKPISLAGPTDTDIFQNDELQKFLSNAKLYVTREEASKCQHVLSRIREIIKLWVKQLTRLRGYPDQMVEDANAAVFTCGSHCLGVHGPADDIETLYTSYVNREEEGAPYRYGEVRPYAYENSNAGVLHNQSAPSLVKEARPIDI
ncbi:hypothetical protein AgCh_020902 [Apium graveolens]